eukprot:m.15532 g.15532  ORF g.15532 m.15532 type:complete len:146 (+) comp10479_c0_seq2:60-497(+)
MTEPTIAYVQRDFSKGTTPCFQQQVPELLKGKVPEAELLQTIATINEFYQEAETPSTSLYCFVRPREATSHTPYVAWAFFALYNCVACLLGQLPLLCFENPYEEYFRKITAYVQHQNQQVFAKHGVTIVDPLRRGLRVLEVQSLK